MPLASIVLLVLLQTSAPDPGAGADPFVRAVEAVAAGRYVELTKCLAEVRAAADADSDAAERARLDNDCVALAGLSEGHASALLDRILREDVSPPVPAAIEALLVRTLGRRARARGDEADVAGARSAGAAAVAVADDSDDPELAEWARWCRVEALLAAGPAPDDGAALADDLRRLRARAGNGSTDRRERVDVAEALLAHRQGDDERALRLLEGIDVRESRDPRALLELRLVVAARQGRFDRAGADAERLYALVDDEEDPAARSASLLALATWEVLRPLSDGEDPFAPHRAAVALCARAAEEARSPAGRAAALEWRGAVRSHLGDHAGARTDFSDAASLYAEAGRVLPAARQQMRIAWDAFAAGAPGEARRALDRFDEALATTAMHATGRLGEERNLANLRARIALAEDDLEGATRELAALFDADRRLTEPLGRRDILLSSDRRGELAGTLISDLLERVDRSPERRARAFELATACAENARVLLLAKLLAGPERASPGLGEGSLPPLPDGVAEVRWTRTADTRERPARYVLLARFGDERVLCALDPVAALDGDVLAFLSRWMDAASLGDEAPDYGAAAHALFLRLFGPAAAWFSGAAPPRRLVVLADGMLERLPVDALVTAPPRADDSFAGLAYVLLTTAVVNAPSLAVLAALPPPNAHPGAVAVIDPVVRGRDGHPLPPLRSARLEREALLSARDATVLRREHATLPRLRRALEERSTGWLHVASHSVPDPVQHDRASLLLTTNEQAPETLGVLQVVRLPLTRGVRVILSGCSTASGIALPGEGVQALWRAFLVAGASCVLSTLRPVDDRSAGHWMREFHAAAARGIPLAEAARQASLAWVDGSSRPEFPKGHAVRDPAHPYLWAAWTCVGHDGGPLPRPSP